MFFMLRKKLKKRYFNYKTSEIRKKASISIDPSSNFTLLTQLCDPDINMYLLALSSFCKHMTPKAIVVISDNLSDENLQILREHVQNINILPIEESRVKELPTGGTWERLIGIQKQSENSYVIQMDADILVLSKPDEVIDAVNRNLSFTMTSKLGFEKMSFINASYLVWERTRDHVQNIAEKAFRECKDPENRLYIRGCSGFAGFAKGSFELSKLIEFSHEVEGKIGKAKWHEWGSEQISSNYIVANSPDSIILPYENYPFYEPGINENNAKVLHFIGTHRFKKGRYIKLSKEIIKSI